jgi:hypothetical protein
MFEPRRQYPREFLGEFISTDVGPFIHDRQKVIFVKNLAERLPASGLVTSKLTQLKTIRPVREIVVIASQRISSKVVPKVLEYLTFKP